MKEKKTKERLILLLTLAHCDVKDTTVHRGPSDSVVRKIKMTKLFVFWYIFIQSLRDGIYTAGFSVWPHCTIKERINTINNCTRALYTYIHQTPAWNWCCFSLFSVPALLKWNVEDPSLTSLLKYNSLIPPIFSDSSFPYIYTLFCCPFSLFRKHL